MDLSATTRDLEVNISVDDTQVRMLNAPGRHDGRYTERTSHLDGWCWWALNMTAFHPQNWTQCVAPRLMGLTLTILIHKRLRSLTLIVLGTIQTTPEERFQISALNLKQNVIPVLSKPQAFGLILIGRCLPEACTRPHHARGLRIRYPCGL